MNLRETVKCNPYTSVFGIVAISMAGGAMLMGKCTFNEFMLAFSVIAGGLGLMVARDGKEDDCKIPPAQDESKKV